MDRADAQKLIRGAIVTVPTPFDGDFKLDLAKMTDMTRWWIEQGLGGDGHPLKVAAAMGEGPDLRDDEWPHLLRTTVDAAAGQANVICALKPKNTLHTIDDARRAQDLGAIGLQIDLPFFHHSTQDDNVRFFSDISDAIDIGIMIYNTHWFTLRAREEYMTAESMLRLRDAEHVAAIKWTVPDGEDYNDMTKFSEYFNVIDNTGSPTRCYKNGGAGYISPLIAVYPAHDIEVLKLLEQGKYDEVDAKRAAVSSVLGDWQAKTAAKSGGYRQMKGMMAALGRPVGPPRLPTLACDDGEIAEVKELVAQLGWS